LCDSTLTAFSPNLPYSYQLFETSIVNAASLSIPQAKPWRKPSVPWWRKDCDVAIKNKKHVFHRMKRTWSITDIIIFKRCRAKARGVILEAKQSSWRKFCSSITSSLEIATAWKKIKRFFGNRDFLGIPILKHNVISGTNDQHKANILSNHFVSITASNYTPEFTANQHRTLHTLQKATRETHPRSIRLNNNVSLSELKFAIKSTRNTSPDADDLCYEMSKHMSDAFFRCF